MISKDLEVSLHEAFVDAHHERYRQITVEHLLLALLTNPGAVQILRACGANLTKLRNSLVQQIAGTTPVAKAGEEVDTQPTMGFQRIIQRAILRVQQSAAKEVTGVDALVALVEEKDSHAVRLLAEQGITRFEVVFCRVHGVAPDAPSYEAPDPEVDDLQVILYNDAYTPMQFVVDLLQKFFLMTEADAKETMLEVHRDGVAVCGLYAREQALELRKAVLDHARQHGHPLNCGVVAPKSS
jgi:ATP-dependent Clp protease adapter protein ClpS